MGAEPSAPSFAPDLRHRPCQLALAPVCATVLTNNQMRAKQAPSCQLQTGGCTMTTHVRCGSLFTGDASPVRDNVTIGIGDDSRIAFVCDTANAPPVSVQDSVLDYGKLF